MVFFRPIHFPNSWRNLPLSPKPIRVILRSNLLNQNSLLLDFNIHIILTRRAIRRKMGSTIGIGRINPVAYYCLSKFPPSALEQGLESGKPAGKLITGVRKIKRGTLLSTKIFFTTPLKIVEVRPTCSSS
jgi:hypothetical protein